MVRETKVLNKLNSLFTGGGGGGWQTGGGSGGWASGGGGGAPTKIIKVALLGFGSFDWDLRNNNLSN